MAFADILEGAGLVPKFIEDTDFTSEIRAFVFDNQRKDKREGWHISMMAECCPRHEIFKIIDPKPDQDLKKPDAIVNMDIGTAMHDFIRLKYLGPMGNLVGDWVCTNKNCNDVVKYSKMPYPNVCPKCENSYNYSEPKVYCPEGSGLKGSFDGLLRFERSGNVVRRVLEIKSKDSNLFFRLKQPDWEHVYQLSNYLSLPLVDANQIPNWGEINEGTILYAAKGLGNTFNMKAFTIKVDKTYLEQSRSKISTVKMSVENKVLPQGICKAPDEKRAMRCSHRLECFNSFYKANFAALENRGKK